LPSSSARSGRECCGVADIINVGLFAAGLRLAVPVLLAALGGLFTDRVGIFNVALEAMMLTGAFAGVAFDYWTGSAWIGVAGAVLGGFAVAAVFALFAMKMKADPIMTGIALNLLIGGLTVVLMQVVFDTRGLFQSSKIALLPQVDLGSPTGGGWRPGLVRMLTGNNALFYAAFVAAPLLHCLFYYTRAGLRIRAVGEYKVAAEAVGVNPAAYQIASILASGVFAGLAGAWMSLSSLGMFSENMTAGRGFIALAAIFFGRSTPAGILLASMFFGLAEAMAIRLQGLGAPSQIVLMIPYAATVASLALTAVDWRRKKAA